MLKNIVSSLFDTINENDAKNDVQVNEPHIAPLEVLEEHIAQAQVPNHLLPIKFTTAKPVVICVYHINTIESRPFILFLLKKHEHELCFIPCPGHKKIKYSALSYVQSLFPEILLSYAGFYEGHKENTIICLARNGNQLSLNTDYFWATPFEIINKKKVMTEFLHPNVLTFFQSNLNFLILKSTDNYIYETPMIGYYYSQQPLTTRIEEMDIYRKTIIPLLGKCYYLDIDIKPSIYSILRIAFFAGKMLIEGEKDRVYDSLLSPSVNKYIIQNYNQHCIISVFSQLE